MLDDEICDRLDQLIEGKTDELGLEILELAIRPDHIHLFITSDPTLAPNRMMQQVKGYSSRHLRDEFGFGPLSVDALVLRLQCGRRTQ